MSWARTNLPAPPPGATFVDLTVVANAAGVCEAFTLDKNGQIWHTYQSFPEFKGHPLLLNPGWFSGWESLSANGFVELCVAVSANQTLVLVAADTHGAIWTAAQTIAPTVDVPLATWSPVKLTTVGYAFVPQFTPRPTLVMQNLGGALIVCVVTAETGARPINFYEVEIIGGIPYIPGGPNKIPLSLPSLTSQPLCLSLMSSGSVWQLLAEVYDSSSNQTFLYVSTASAGSSGPTFTPFEPAPFLSPSNQLAIPYPGATATLTNGSMVVYYPPTGEFASFSVDAEGFLYALQFGLVDRPLLHHPIVLLVSEFVQQQIEGDCQHGFINPAGGGDQFTAPLAVAENQLLDESETGFYHQYVFYSSDDGNTLYALSYRTPQQVTPTLAIVPLQFSSTETVDTASKSIPFAALTILSVVSGAAGGLAGSLKLFGLDVNGQVYQWNQPAGG